MTKRLLDLILIATTTIQSFSQTFDSNDICYKIVQVDTVEFNSNYIKGDFPNPTKRFIRDAGKVTIKTKTTVYTFKDNVERGDTIVRHRSIGEISENWIWVEEQHLHSTKYFLINGQTSTVDTLVGPPRLFGDKLVCLEDGYTDSPRFVEIYKIKNDRLIPLRKFRLNPCDKLCCVRTIYLKGKTIYLADNWNKKYRAWKARVL